ncbi:hypothetical protein [Streptomyces sp. NPDC046712]|uniref:hypothetical protein n=1 Tax=Streptomyces sp. NPDC046712 TaxID=3154802 RepID=UPI0033EFF935
MRTRPTRRSAVLVLPLTFSLAACGTADDDGAAGPTAASTPLRQESAEPTAAQTPEPESPEEFLDLAEKAMRGENAWTFSVRGQEGLTLQGQKSAATYRATVRRGMKSAALHSQGVSTGSKGTKKTEELYVVGDTAYLKEGGAAWKSVSAADPEMRNKAEDPVAVIQEFRMYAQARNGDVKLTEASGTVELRVESGRRQLTAVRDRAWAKKAEREFAPTAAQLRTAGIPVRNAELTLSGLEEVLVLDAKTYRIKSHRFEFGFLVPYNGQKITFEQDVREENTGTYDGRIELPAGVS